MTNLVLLDRDGVINYDSPDYIKTPEEWIPIPGSIEAIALFKKAGWLVAIATNQSGIFRGYYDENTLTQIHQKLNQALATFEVSIDAIYFCPHGPHENCSCRKPKPGLLKQALKQFSIDPRQTNIPMIGDSMRDIQAAQSAHCQPVLVKTGNGLKTLTQSPAYHHELLIFDNLWEAAQYFCHQTDLNN